MSKPAPVILLVDDRVPDILLTKRAICDAGFEHVQIHTAINGQEALDMLLSGEAKPDLILLDMMMPVMDGLEFLQHREADPAIKQVPVLVLTTSRSDRDVNEAYSAGANGYLQKPVGIDAFNTVISKLAGFWLETVELPVRE